MDQVLAAMKLVQCWLGVRQVPCFLQTALLEESGPCLWMAAGVLKTL